MSNNKIYGLAILTILLSVLLISLPALQKDEKVVLTGQAAGSNCGTLKVAFSKDGINPTTYLTVGSNYSKYYLHTTDLVDSGKKCSINLEVTASHCDLNNQNCTAWSVPALWKVPEWGTVRTNSDGIARIDYQNKPGIIHAKFRPYGTGVSFSSQITLKTTTQPEILEEIDMSQYYLFEPGYTHLMISENKMVNPSAKYIFRNQIEEETYWCDILTRPWRHTKNHTDAFWNSFVPGVTADYPGDAAWANRYLRWMMVSPNYYYSTAPKFNDFYWAIGDKRYTMRISPDNNPGTVLVHPNNKERGKTVDPDILPEQLVGILQYGTVDSDVTPYSGSLKTVKIPFSLATRKTNHTGVNADSPAICPNVYKPGEPVEGVWRMRIDKDYININNPHFKYSGPAIRIDYHEGPTGGTEEFHRESWYFIKNIGFAYYTNSHFNGYGNMCTDSNNLNCARFCGDNSDCLSDTIENPHTVASLDRYFLNPRLNITVSSDGVNYASSVDIPKDGNYYLKATDAVNNFPYTGYLEEKDRDNKITKWLWVEDGVARASVKNPSPGRYRSNFRIWVPDETFPGETRASDVNSTIEWSTDIFVNVTTTINSTPTPTAPPAISTVTPAPISESFSIQYEAESGGIVSPFSINADSQASGGKFVTTPQSQVGSVIINFSTPSSQTYYIWARAKGISWNANSFFVSIDNASPAQFEIPTSSNGQWTWVWKKIGQKLLTAGNHSIIFRGREAGANLDAIIVSSKASFTPSGTGLLSSETPVSPVQPTVTTAPTSSLSRCDTKCSYGIYQCQRDNAGKTGGACAVNPNCPGQDSTDAWKWSYCYSSN